MRALVADPALAVLVRPDRVIAAVGARHRPPRLPWHIPATAHPLAHADTAGPLPTAR